MRAIIGGLLMMAGICFGLYMGVWWALIGGIIDILNTIKSSSIDSMVVAVGIAKILLSSGIGIFAGAIAAFPGYVLIHWGEE